MQRVRVTFGRGEELKYITHLDMMRLWERALRRAGLTLAYSEGFAPHPKLSLAAPLAVGVTSQGELMDVFLEKGLALGSFVKALIPQLPPAIELIEAKEIGLGFPSLQSLMRYAEYLVQVETDRPLTQVDESLRDFLALKSLPWQHTRDTEVRRYDLRVLVENLWLAQWRGCECVLGMRLKTDSSAAGRPEQVTLALGFSQHPNSIHRTRLILEEPGVPNNAIQRGLRLRQRPFRKLSLHR